MSPSPKKPLPQSSSTVHTAALAADVRLLIEASRAQVAQVLSSALTPRSWDPDQRRIGDRLTPDLVFRHPSVLAILGFAERERETDVKSAILAELQRFILEMGSGFAFLTREKRITIDGRDCCIDLLFHHRRLRCLVAIGLDLGELQAVSEGRMEPCLRWLDRHERVEGEETPIGLILRVGECEEQVQLVQLDRGDIRAAECVAALPAREFLQAWLHQSITIARQRLAAREG